MFILCRFLLVLSVVMLAPCSAHAAVLFSSQVEASSEVGDGYMLSLPDTMLAQSFSLDSRSRLDSLQFFAGFNPMDVTPASVSWGIYHAVPGSPAGLVARGWSSADLQQAQAFSVSISNQTPILADFEFRFDLGLGGIKLEPGSYWLALHVQPVGQQGGSIHWLGAHGNQQSAMSNDGGAGWESTSGSRAFQFNGVVLPAGEPDPDPVPEPATVLLMGLGLLALALQSLQGGNRRNRWSQRNRCSQRAALPGVCSTAWPAPNLSDFFRCEKCVV